MISEILSGLAVARYQRSEIIVKNIGWRTPDQGEEGTVAFNWIEPHVC